MPTQTCHNPNLTLVIDQGSHASRIVLFSETGELIYLKSIRISTHSTKESIHHNIYEHDANEILLSIQTLLENIPSELSHNITCCGLCTQRSTIVAWHKTSGETLSPAISWRDTRCQPLIDKLTPSANEIRKISGLPLSAHYSAGKMSWLLNNNKTVKSACDNSQLCISPLASYLIFHLLKEKTIKIDHSNAQRCQLFDIQKLSWSDKLLSLYKIEKNILPKCVPVIYNYGELKFNNIPLTTVCGDQNAVLYAYPALPESTALINIGTGAFILSTSSESHTNSPRLLHTIASSDTEKANYITEGTVNGAGSAISWAQKKYPCEDVFTQLPDWLEKVKSPPVFINSISNLGSPWWCNAGEPAFIGKHKAQQAERYVAIIESILFLIQSNLQCLTITPDSLFISGGLSQLDTLCQKLATLAGIKVYRFTNTEATARGCAWLANQLLENNNLSWKTLEFSEYFYPEKKTPEDSEIGDRYEQFVGELNKRCNSD
ncbi:MAG: hypothetical protein DIZ80_16300 [endosymbiont of Galathealinum brachiosum]|uniref:Glycerol kinase n=1 Tax=endosymbiont of Galathealinum brachiosum TaxID=2200906 RepID=A0A370DAL9_9GAMM|nr:MAG: hypothetical protein DIZ80_16300 [endosymbiont of Galathealinum brachiosum]